MRIEVLPLGVVYEAPPDDPYGHACEPRIARLADGTILVSHRAGTRRESADGRPHLLRSRDAGRTWEDLGRPFDPPSAAGWDLRGFGLTQLLSGDVLGVVIGLDKRLDRPVYNPDGEG
ncbi:MAG: glycoside hydrolase, partial [Thermoplasmata archaeon]|nr:glycoside hydrolase [Thermoplasmata archaeon]